MCAGSHDTFEIFVWSMQTGRLLEVRVRGRQGGREGGRGRGSMQTGRLLEVRVRGREGPCRPGGCWR